MEAVIITQRFKNILMSFLIVFILISSINYSHTLSNTVVNTLIFCGTRLIPSLFPVMILSSFAVKLNLFKGLFDRLFTKISACLKVSRAFLPAIISSYICGFVTGTREIDVISSGVEIDKKQYTDSIFLSCNAGIGFVITFIGGALWNNFSFGIVLFIFQIVSSIIVHLIFKTCYNDFIVKEVKHKKSIFQLLTESVSSSTRIITDICGFTVFFSALLELISLIFSLEKASLSYTLIANFLDITKGEISSLQLNNFNLSSFLCGFALGFSGICAIMQTISVSNHNLLNIKRFFVKKFLQGILCGIFTCIYTKAFNIEMIKLTSTVLLPNLNLLDVFTISIFIFCAISKLKKFLLKNV